MTSRNGTELLDRYLQKNKRRSLPDTIYKVISTRIKDLDFRPKIMNYIEEICNILQNTDFSDKFRNSTSVIRKAKQKENKRKAKQKENK